MISEISKLDWSSTYDSKHLITSIQTLVEIRPQSDDLQKLRISTLVDALSSNFSSIKNATTTALMEIVTNEQTAVVQKTIFIYAIMDWNSFYQQESLLKMIEIAGKMKPETHEIEQVRIKYLAPALRAESTDVRKRATETLAIISKSANLNDRDQILLLQEFKKLDWKTNTKQAHYQRILEILSELAPMNSDVKSLRIEVLSLALNADYAPTRDFAAEVLRKLANK